MLVFLPYSEPLLRERPLYKMPLLTPHPARGVKAPCRQFTCLGTREASSSVYFSFP